MLSLARARRLLESKQRRATGLFLVEGPHVVRAALDAGTPLTVLFVAEGAPEGGEVEELCARAAGAGIAVQRVDDADLASIADTTTPQGLVGVAPVRACPPPEFDRPGVWLWLDGVQDPGNVGTLLRTAEAFGARGVIAAKGTADPWSGKVVRAAQGAHFRLDVWAEKGGATTAGEVLDRLAAAGGELWATGRDGEDVFASGGVPERCVVAVGNEARGLSAELAGRAARCVAVPQRGRADSLNVAMAASVVLAWLARPARGGGES
jgi:TrmH family RNA methyltransferase